MKNIFENLKIIFTKVNEKISNNTSDDDTISDLPSDDAFIDDLNSHYVAVSNWK